MPRESQQEQAGRSGSRIVDPTEPNVEAAVRFAAFQDGSLDVQERLHAVHHDVDTVAVAECLQKGKWVMRSGWFGSPEAVR